MNSCVSSVITVSEWAFGEIVLPPERDAGLIERYQAAVAAIG